MELKMNCCETSEALKLELKKVNILSTDSMDIYKQKINQFWKNVLRR